MRRATQTKRSYANAAQSEEQLSQREGYVSFCQILIEFAAEKKEQKSKGKERERSKRAKSKKQNQKHLSLSLYIVPFNRLIRPLLRRTTLSFAIHSHSVPFHFILLPFPFLPFSSAQLCSVPFRSVPFASAQFCSARHSSPLCHCHCHWLCGRFRFRSKWQAAAERASEFRPPATEMKFRAHKTRTGNVCLWAQ